MKILAPFDQSHTSQATIPLLVLLARSSAATVEVTLLSSAKAPMGTPARRSVHDGVAVTQHTQELPVRLPEIEPRATEARSQAAERVLAQLHDYLLAIAGRLPPGTRVNTEAYLTDRPGMAIHECAMHRRVDVIVMATRSRPRTSYLTSQLLLGSTAEAIVYSGVAPTLIVHPPKHRTFEQIDPAMFLTRRARFAQKPFWSQ